MMAGGLRAAVVGAGGLAGVALGAHLVRGRIWARLFGLGNRFYPVTLEHDLRVPMTDGVVLMADHYAPTTPGDYPTILIRTPYGRGREAGVAGNGQSFLARRVAEQGYHVVIQGVRGRFDSGGVFEPLKNEAADGTATLDWLERQTWYTGKVGLWGQSYVGYVQWAVSPDPRIGALVPCVTGSNFYTLSYTDGAFDLDIALRWANTIAMAGAPDSPKGIAGARRSAAGMSGRTLEPAFRHLPLLDADAVGVGKPVAFYREWVSHSDPADPYWQRDDHSANVPRTTAPVHLVGGWYDILLRELLADYQRLVDAGRTPYLTIGPHYHLQAAQYPLALREAVAWFDAQLKHDTHGLRRAPVRLFVLGANTWREMAAWPPPSQPARYHLHAGGRLAPDAPAAVGVPDSYTYDPANPTPIVGGPIFTVDAGARDQRTTEARPDVLIYTTPPLTDAVEAIGAVRVELYVRSSLPHTDFFGRVCDVRPDGRSFNVCDGLIRVAPGVGRPQPDGSLCLGFDLYPTAYRFQPGHRIRIQISSGAHPRYSRNLGTGEPPATATRMQPAAQTIYHDTAHPSALILPLTAGA